LLDMNAMSPPISPPLTLAVMARATGPAARLAVILSTTGAIMPSREAMLTSTHALRSTTRTAPMSSGVTSCAVCATGSWARQAASRSSATASLASAALRRGPPRCSFLPVVAAKRQSM